MAVVKLYGRPGCHLCEQAREVVASVRAERSFELREVDVTLDPVLERRYGERIPVLEVDGEEAFEYFVEREQLLALLGRASTHAR